MTLKRAREPSYNVRDERGATVAVEEGVHYRRKCRHCPELATRRSGGTRQVSPSLIEHPVRHDVQHYKHSWRTNVEISIPERKSGTVKCVSRISFSLSLITQTSQTNSLSSLQELLRRLSQMKTLDGSASLFCFQHEMLFLTNLRLDSSV